MKLKRNDLLTIAFILDDIMDKNDIYKYIVEEGEITYWVVGIKRSFTIRFRKE